MNIYIIDQDPAVSYAIKEYIEYYSKEQVVKEVHTLEEGKKILTTEKPDLALIDITPSKNFLPLFDVAKSNGHTIAVPMSTLSTNKQYTNSPYFLNKPFTLDEIDKIITDTKKLFDKPNKPI